VRSALGVSRVALFRQVAIESLLLAFGGGVFGIALAWGIVRLFKAIGGHAIPCLDMVTTGWAVLAGGLIACAAKFETNVLRESLQFAGIAREEDLRATRIEEVRVPFLFKTPLNRWTKAQSEQLIYLASIGGWLVPLGIAIYRLVVSY